MTGDHERFEEYLRQFTPRRPAALPLPPSRRPIWWGVSAAAAIAVAIVTWASLADERAAPNVAQPDKGRAAAPPGTRSSLVAEWDVEAVDEMLIRVSRRVLPDVERPDGSLRQLARP